MLQRLLVEPGEVERLDIPLNVVLPDLTADSYWFQIGQMRLPAQRVGNQLWCLVPRLPAKQLVEAVVEPAEGVHPHRVSVEESHDRIAIYTDGKLFTAYVKAGNPARPCFYPLRGPRGVNVTRHWPMHHGVPGETNDHVHHRSMWIAFGDVNGVDNWSEEPGHGYTLHRQTLSTFSGFVCGGFETLSDWTDAQGNKLLEQHLKVRVFPLPEEEHLVDIEVTLTATNGAVRFGDTKEGGILAVRVASSMDVPRGGRIENSEGGVNEAQTWGKRAHWCDYSGIVQEVPVGIAIMQHPSSFRHPAWWHVRDYGLMAVNPFGLSAFTNGREHGEYELPEGQSLHWYFRVCVHRGDAQTGAIAQRWQDWTSPPIVKAMT